MFSSQITHYLWSKHSVQLSLITFHVTFIDFKGYNLFFIVTKLKRVLKYIFRSTSGAIAAAKFTTSTLTVIRSIGRSLASITGAGTTRRAETEVRKTIFHRIVIFRGQNTFFRISKIVSFNISRNVGYVSASFRSDSVFFGRVEVRVLRALI